MNEVALDCLMALCRLQAEDDFSSVCNRHAIHPIGRDRIAKAIMESGTVVTSKSAAFNSTGPKGYCINPPCFGDDLAKWLTGELHKRGVARDDCSGQEDFGW
jgi:hypothetical protein